MSQNRGGSRQRMSWGLVALYSFLPAIFNLLFLLGLLVLSPWINLTSEVEMGSSEMEKERLILLHSPCWLIQAARLLPQPAALALRREWISRGEGSVPFWDTCVWIWGGYGANLAAGMAGVVQDNGWARGAVAQLGWGAALPGSALPAGRGWCLHSASFTSPHGTCPAPQYSWDHLVLPTQPLC